MDSLIARILQDFSLDLYRPVFPRDLSLGTPLEPKAGNLVTVITGMRRSGKSYRLFQQMEQLHDQGVPYEHMLYFNFEDDRLAPITPQTGDTVLETFYTLHPECLEEGAYLFLDELQEMENWGTWMRRVVDTHRVTVYATGSSSRMLSSEIATEFRGRSIAYEQLPLSFSEYVRWHHPDISQQPVGFSTKRQIILQNAFETYLTQGGFPAVQDLSAARAVMVLQSYAQQVVARDVIERNNLSNPRAATLFARTVMGCNGRSLSLRKTANDFKSRGLTVSREMLAQMLGQFEEAFLIGRVRSLSRSAADSNQGLVKLYAIDPGLAAANAPASTVDTGQRLEDAVYLELRRRQLGQRDNTIAYLKTHKSNYEVDFCVGDALFEEPTALYQITESLEKDATRTRETRALFEALDEHPNARAFIIVRNGFAETIEKAGKQIVCLPAWQWFLRQPAAL